MNAPLAHFIVIYLQRDRQQWHRLPEIYAEQVVFVDPVCRIEGLAALTRYFSALYRRFEHCRVEIVSQQQQGDEAWLGWVMTFVHPRLAGGKPIRVEGATRLQFDPWGKVRLQREYFDLGAMLYEQVPLLGRFVRALRARLGA